MCSVQNNLRCDFFKVTNWNIKVDTIKRSGYSYLQSYKCCIKVITWSIVENWCVHLSSFMNINVECGKIVVLTCLGLKFCCHSVLLCVCVLGFSKSVINMSNKSLLGLGYFSFDWFIHMFKAIQFYMKNH